MFHHLDITSCHARALPWAYGMLIHCHGFVKKIINVFLKKIIWRNNIAIHNTFKKN
jgi:hypothetical protein